MKKLLLSLSLFCTMLVGNINLFSPDETARPMPVRESLKQLGAEPVTFTTTDGIPIKALFTYKEHATATIIVVPGFLGIKESYAAFVQHFPTYNILLMDQRGRGESGGPRWWKTLLSYGIHDYLDIVAAIHFVSEKTKKPIIVYGSCAGAFNSSRALIYLQKNNLLEKFQVKGFVFESGWHSVSNAGMSAALGDISSNIFNYVQGKTPVPNQQPQPTVRSALDTIRKTKIFGRLYGASKEIMHLVYWAVGDHMTDLDTKVDTAKDLRTLPIPIFFIHALDDHYIPFSSAYMLSKTVKDAQCWWIGKGASWHVRHHCYLGNEFQQKVENFCEYALQK